jgi:hypothetical protein
MANPSRSLGFLPEPWGWRVQRERPSLQQGQVWVFVLKDLPTEVFNPLRAQVPASEFLEADALRSIDENNR